MARRYERLALAALLATTCFLARLPDALAETSNLESTVDAYAYEFAAGDGVAGVTVAIAKGDDLVYAKGFGFADLENNIPAIAETVYRIGSITKSFTAAAILQLVEAGDLTLDTTLGAVLPDYPEPGRAVTIRQLLTHTSGIPSFTSFPDYAERKRDDLDHDEMVTWFGTKPLEFEPGTQFRYSNSGYYVLGLVIEHVSHERYDAYLQSHVYPRARLSATRYDWRAPIVPNRAHGYRYRDGVFEHPDYISMQVPYAAGALASTALDLLRWMQALSQGRVVSKDSFARMTVETELPNGHSEPYGLGLALGEIDGHRVIRHAGGIDGFRSDLAYSPETGWIVAILANSENAEPGDLTNRVLRFLAGQEEMENGSGH